MKRKGKPFSATSGSNPVKNSLFSVANPYSEAIRNGGVRCGRSAGIKKGKRASDRLFALFS
jgi:hypothetical protein